MLKLEVKNFSEEKVPGDLRLAEWLGKTVKVLGKGHLVGGIEMNFVEAAEIKALNKRFRGKDKVTDVLSFSFLEGEKFPTDDLVGQIFLEPLIAKKQAEEHGVNWKDEIEFLFVHALLHVFGYDHEEESDFREMYGLQAQIMPGLKWENFVRQIFRESFGGREF